MTQQLDRTRPQTARTSPTDARERLVLWSISAAEHVLTRSAAERSLVSLPIPAEVAGPLIARDLIQLRDVATVLWERPSEGVLLVGIGEAARIGGPRDSALSNSRRHLSQLRADMCNLVTGIASPRMFGGARFRTGGAVRDPRWDGFGGWQFVVPEVLIEWRSGQVGASLTLRVAPLDDRVSISRRLVAAFDAAVLGTRSAPVDGSRPSPHTDVSPADWQRRIAAVVHEIADGDYAKTVLARSVSLPVAGDTGSVLGRLSERYPRCRIFKYAVGDAAWIGASPELLAAVHDGVVRAASLAGSRSRGATPEDDQRLAEDLLSSGKDRVEHALVASALAEGLSPLCFDVSAPAAPVIMTQPNIHHLYTPFEGRLRDGADILDVVARLHPTPAVGGSPRTEALDAIERLEQMDRGWYAGPIGWIDFDGEGEFAVALRSGLLCDGTATLFAGAGIVEGSVPASEFAETEVKLRPLREAIGGA